MHIFTISDLHLALGVPEKSMEIFGGWQDYTARIRKNWEALITDRDLVVLPGDLSWGMNLTEAAADFAFLHSLPGKKVLIKGNHDLWWVTAAKVRNFLAGQGYDDISFVFNNCCPAGKYGICGTRGWVYDSSAPADEKIIARECGRLETSISACEQAGLEPLVFLHYPPVFGDAVIGELMAVLERHGIKELYYGHIHGSGGIKAPVGYGEIGMHLVSADSRDFTPLLVRKNAEEGSKTGL